MTKFANVKASPRAAVTLTSPKGIIKTKSQTPDAVTYEGGDGYDRKAKSELFLLAITNMVGEDTFYESATDRDARFEELVHKVTQKDPDWIRRFVPYMRNQLNLRTASIVMAAEYVKAGGPNGRSVVDSALQRADEPSVLLAYWRERHGVERDGRKDIRKLPAAIKRGVADAVTRLYTERNLIKYDSDTLNPRFGDVVEVTHAKGKTPWQHDLFRYAMAKRHNREDLSRDIEQLQTISKFRALMAAPVAERRAMVEAAAESGDLSKFEGAGLTWENLSGWLQGPMDAKAWELVIPQMHYMALLRNLRNFDQAGISDAARESIIKKLTDPQEVKESRQLPLRFFTAYKNVKSLNWAAALEKALDLTLVNVPVFKGKTLILVDVSQSMWAPFSKGNTRTYRVSNDAYTPQRYELAALFGAAIALRAEKPTLVTFGTDSHEVDVTKGGSILRLVEQMNHNRGGTQTWHAVARHFDGHDRIIMLTDEQAQDSPMTDLTGTPIYVYSLAGYKVGITSSGADNYTFGGLSDAGFRAIEAIEASKDAAWPF